MRFLATLASVSAFVGWALAAPIVVSPGGAGDIIITQNNTVNGTAYPRVKVPASTGSLSMSLVNNLASGSLYAYVTGLDSNNQLVMLQPDGTWHYPSASSAATPQAVTANVAIPLTGLGKATQMTLPSEISAGRVWFAESALQFFTVSNGNGGQSLVEPSAVNPSDPSANVNWGFVELTNTVASGLFANISYVDFVGLVLGMKLTTKSGGTQTAQGLQPGAVASICTDLKAQAAKDGQPWDQLCVTDQSGKPLRVLAPTDYISINPSAFANYWTPYVNSVWSHYTTTPLQIDTQASAGVINCQISSYDNTLSCAGDNRAYAKPSASDIFGCNSGPFAILAGDNDIHRAVVPRLCAAFDRSTLLINGGNVQPGPSSSTYYTAGSPTNWYSAIVHKYEIDGKGYAFSYDDVNPDNGENESGVVSAGDPAVLTVTIGGPSYAA